MVGALKTVHSTSSPCFPEWAWSSCLRGMTSLCRCILSMPVRCPCSASLSGRPVRRGRCGMGPPLLLARLCCAAPIPRVVVLLAHRASLRSCCHCHHVILALHLWPSWMPRARGHACHRHANTRPLQSCGSHPCAFTKDLVLGPLLCHETLHNAQKLAAN